jgi:hypothetical protein
MNPAVWSAQWSLSRWAVTKIDLPRRFHIDEGRAQIGASTARRVAADLIAAGRRRAPSLVSLPSIELPKIFLMGRWPSNVCGCLRRPQRPTSGTHVSFMDCTKRCWTPKSTKLRQSTGIVEVSGNYWISSDGAVAETEGFEYRNFP